MPRKKPVRPLRLCVYDNRLWRCDTRGRINWTNTQNYLIEHLPDILASGRPVQIIPFTGEIHTHYRKQALASLDYVYPGLKYYHQSNAHHAT